MAGDATRRQQTTQPPRQCRYTILYLRADGQIDAIVRTAPALPAFEDAFAVLGRGAILSRPSGPVAVEDLQPGDDVLLSDGRYASLVWHGAVTLTPPQCAERHARLALTRITTDALGLGRPMQDLILGPAARLHLQATEIRRLTGSPGAYIPASDFVDGHHFITLRPTNPVDLYQLGFARHETVLVNGIGVESLHPGTAFSLGLSGTALAQYMGLFPHLRSLDEIGLPRHPRLRLPDLEMID